MEPFSQITTTIKIDYQDSNSHNPNFRDNKKKEEFAPLKSGSRYNVCPSVHHEGVGAGGL